MGHEFDANGANVLRVGSILMPSIQSTRKGWGENAANVSKQTHDAGSGKIARNRESPTIEGQMKKGEERTII